MTGRPLTEIRSELRGLVSFAGFSPSAQEKFGKVLLEAKAICGPEEWKALLQEIGMVPDIAGYYLKQGAKE